MLMFLCTFAIGFLWLMRETDWLRVRLPIGDTVIYVVCAWCGKDLGIKAGHGQSGISHGICQACLDLLHEKPESRLELETPKRVMPCPEIKPEPVYLLPQTCEFTTLQTEAKGTRYGESWVYGTGYNTRRRESYQTMTFGGFNVSILATSPKLYDVIADVQRVANGKDRKVSFKPYPLSSFIETVRIGSHQEPDSWIANDGKEYHSTRTITDYTTNFRDCLCGKEWLEAHYEDVIPEPTIELSVNGKSLSINGNFKTGMIKSFCKGTK